MRTLIAATALAMALSPALAQFDRFIPERSDKIQDRHPAYFRDLVEERRVTTEAIHSFEQRWEPVEQLLFEQRAREQLKRSNAPAAVPVQTATVLPVVKPSIRRPDQATCLRHNLRTVWNGQSWRCRK